MSTKYDRSGKVFTNVVSKVPVRVIIQTKTSRVLGEIHRMYDERVLDTLNNGEQFLAVTNATIYEQHGEEEIERQVAFLALNRDNIDWVTPESEEQ